MNSFVDDVNREIATEDDTSVLAFSIIMLNTDQHNPQVRASTKVIYILHFLSGECHFSIILEMFEG